ncbi:MAG TPA: GatB/YqeY domain-containing protein [Chitinophagaceae bacterium]|nr:GatB/YqeY domain-containing protein [Chitinophagaceae bacterium]
MSLEQDINQHLKDAMKAKDQIKLRGLRAIKSAILLSKTSGKGTDLSEKEEIQLLQKLVKQRKDSLEIYQEQNRPELAKKEEEEIEVISAFLPKQMDEEEVKEKIQQIIEDVGASSPADMGKVMGAAMKQLSGKADGKMISSVAKALLAG